VFRFLHQRHDLCPHLCWDRQGRNFHLLYLQIWTNFLQSADASLLCI
jgi:hypothetical protein